LASGTGPEFFFEWGGALSGIMIQSGHVLPLNKYYDKYGWKKILIPWGYEKVRENSAQFGKPGNIYGVLFSTQAMTFWYNKPLWNKLGLQIPKTYQEMEQVNQKIVQAGLIPCTLGGRYDWMTMRIVDYLLEVTAGPKLHDQLLLMKTSWDRPEVVQAFALFKKWVDNKWIIPDFLNTLPQDSHLPMYQGKAVYTIEGPWMASTLQNDQMDAADYGFFIHPTGHTPLRLSGFIEQMMVNADKPKLVQDTAADVINWMVQPEVQSQRLLVNSSTGTVGATVDPSQHPLLAESLKVLSGLQGTWLVMDQSLPEEPLHVYFQAQDELASGQTTPAEAAKTVQQAIEKYKSENKM
ncbi:MAG TPA: extracellular solute-binding protein, partial [Spirochaetia bacterium]|nr:extracellular solute-binding protein [Spirochaetia bacterium]